MDSLFLIVSIVLGLILNDKCKEIKNLTKENQQLRQNIYNMANKLNSLNTTTIKEDLPVLKNETEVLEKQVVKKPQVINEVKESNIVENNAGENKVVNKELKRNNLILITGSIFIILAALVFVTSTWYLLSNYIKAGILSLLVFVFLGASHYANTKLKVEKTSQAFFYIAMFYIPIVLFSFSYFELFGEYISYRGQGFSLYLTIMFIITSIIYILASKRGKWLTLFSYIFQILSLMSFSAFIKYGMSLTFFLITLYTLGLLCKNKFYKDSNISNFLEVGLTIILSFTLVFDMSSFIIFYKDFFSYIDIFNILSCLILFIIFLIRLDKYKFGDIGCNLLGIIIMASIIKLFEFNLVIESSLMIITLLGIYAINEMINRNNMRYNILILGISTLFLFVSVVLSNYYISLVIGLLVLVVCFIRYILTKENNYLVFNIWLSVIIYMLIVLIFKLEYSFFVGLLLIDEIIMSICINYVKDDNFNKKLEISTNLIFLPNYLIFILTYIIGERSVFFMMPLLVAFLSILNYRKNNKTYNLLITYFSVAIVLEALNNWILIVPRYLSFIIVGIAIILGQFIRKENFKDISIYLIYYFISLIVGLIADNMIIHIISIIYVLINIIYLEYVSDKKDLNIVSYIFLTILLYIRNIQYEEIIFNYLISYVLVLLWFIKGFIKKERDITDWLSLLYIVLNGVVYGIDKYITLSILIIWGLINLNKKGEKLVKFILYGTCLILYNCLISDLELNYIVLLNLLGYFIVLLLITRTIIVTYDKTLTKFLEIIGLLLLDVVAIGLYQDEIDGAIFVSFLVLLMIFSYIKKLGPSFYTSLIFIIFNVFLLTRWFWFSVPWWLYLLFIGIILIMFATNNELQNNIKNSKILKDLNERFKE